VYSACYCGQTGIKLEFSRQFAKNPQILNFMKIRPVGAELFREERRTDMTKLIVALRDFANVYKNLQFDVFVTGKL
jgi:hypothetical protein